MAQQNDPTTWTFPHCPVPPDRSSPDWPALQARFSWLRELEGVPQDPMHHAEGDVLIHTRMVTEVLLALDEWRKLASPDRQVLYASALLHDAGKPNCTVLETGGRVTSRGHAKKGEKMARRLLWLGEQLPAPAPFPTREHIALLVRLHGLPLHFLEQPDPARAVIQASQQVRLDQVALLAEADVRGRICPDQQTLLDTIALFRDFCQEQRCYTAPRSFANEQSRFFYLHNGRGNPDYEAYDETRCEVVVLAGLPGVGKDTWIQANLPDWPVISLDALRAELKISPTDDQGYLIQVAQERARALLRQRRSFIWNATNVLRVQRRRVLNLALAYRARTRLVYLNAPFADIIKRNRARQASVPEEVIYHMLNNLEMPDVSEAYRVEWIDA